MAGLLHDVGHGPFGHFFDDNFLADIDLTHELVGQRIIREELGDTIRGLRRSPHGAFEPGETIEPEWICYLMGKAYTQPAPGDPRWLAFLKPVLSGIYTADNLDYVLRDAHMCGVAVGTDLDRIIYYSFFTPEGLTLDRSGTQALIMFLTARFYMYTNVYYHRTTRAIDLHLKEIFRPTMRIVFPWDLRKDLHRYLHLTEWGLLEEVGRWDTRRTPSGRPSAGSGGRCSIAASGGGWSTRRSSTTRRSPAGRACARSRSRPRCGRRSRRRSGGSSSRSTSRSRTRGPRIRSRWGTGRSTCTTA